MPFLQPKSTGKFSVFLLPIPRGYLAWQIERVDEDDVIQGDNYLRWQLLATGLDRLAACDLLARLLASPLYRAGRLVEEWDRPGPEWVPDQTDAGETT